MNINSSNLNFNGKLYLNNPEAWTEKMKVAILSNESIRKALSGKDMVGDIFVKKEDKMPPVFARHCVGDPLYKVSFTVFDEDQVKFGKLKRLVFSRGKKYVVNHSYHSEYTTVERLKGLKIDE